MRLFILISILLLIKKVNSQTTVNLINSNITINNFWKISTDNLFDTILANITHYEESSDDDYSGLPIEIFHFKDTFETDLYIVNNLELEPLSIMNKLTLKSSWKADTLYHLKDILIRKIEYDTLKNLSCELYEYNLDKYTNILIFNYKKKGIMYRYINDLVEIKSSIRYSK